MGLNTAKIDSFSGGLNLVDDPMDLDLNEFVWTGSLPTTTKNVEIVGAGKKLIARRSTQVIPTTAALPSTAGFGTGNAMTAMTSFDDATKVIMSTNLGVVYVLTPNVSPATFALVLNLGSTGEWMFHQSQDNVGTAKIYMVNGTDTPRAYTIGAGTVALWPGTPPVGSILTVWKNRMIVSGVTAQRQRLYYSDIANPESWPANNFIDIKSTDDENDDILGLQVIGENLLVFKRDSVWLVFDPVTFENRRLANIGILNRKCAVSYNDVAYWVSPVGVYSTDGDTVNYESRNIKPLFDAIPPGSFTASRGTLIATEDTLLFIAYGAGNPYGGVWQMYLNLKRRDGQHPWLFHGASATTSPFYSCSCMVPIRADVLGQHNGNRISAIIGAYSDTVGPAQRLARYYATNLVDETSDPLVFAGVDAQYVSPWLALQGSENKERLRRINLEMRGASTISVYEDQSGSAAFSAAVVDSSTGFVRVRPDARGRFHKLVVASNITSPLSNQLELNAIEMKYRGGKEH